MRGLVIDIIKKNHLESPTVGIFTTIFDTFRYFNEIGEGEGGNGNVSFIRVLKKKFFFISAHKFK